MQSILDTLIELALTFGEETYRVRLTFDRSFLNLCLSVTIGDDFSLRRTFYFRIKWSISQFIQDGVLMFLMIFTGIWSRTALRNNTFHLIQPWSTSSAVSTAQQRSQPLMWLGDYQSSLCCSRKLIVLSWGVF